MSCCGAGRAPSWIKFTAVPSEPAQANLKGVRVLVTRPAHQADALVHLIEAEGGEAIRLPTIEIAPPTDPGALDAVLKRWADFHLVIFVSPNAVRAALPRLRAFGMPPTLPCAAVGQGTQQALRAEGFENVLAPSTSFDSEALLELLPTASVAGKNILIVRGTGGRALLGETLGARGARVSHAESYRRLPPRQPDRTALMRLRRDEIDIINITSVEGLQNLYALVTPAERGRLLATPILVVGERQARTGRDLGFTSVQVAARASDTAILDALRTWRVTRNSI